MSSFQMKFGKDIEQAARITALIFEQGYGMQPDFQMEITTE